MGHGDVHSKFAHSKPNQAAVITKVNPTPSPSKMSAKEIRMKSCRYHANDLKMFMICLLGYLYCTSPCCKPYSWPQCKPAHNALETPDQNTGNDLASSACTPRVSYQKASAKWRLNEKMCLFG